MKSRPSPCIVLLSCSIRRRRSQRTVDAAGRLVVERCAVVRLQNVLRPKRGQVAVVDEIAAKPITGRR